jgi:hypothetical protein
MTQEALSSLQTLGAQLRAKLLELPEYRALTVIERTIQELSEIMNATTAAPDRVEVQAVPVLASASIVAAPQSRMARAIAETIAAKAAPFAVSATGVPHPSHPLNAAS